MKTSPILTAFILMLTTTSVNANHHNDKATDLIQKEDVYSIYQTGSFELDISPEKALPLFTAPGEKLWIPTWKPSIITGDGFEQGTQFLTQHGGHLTHWYVAAYDTVSKHAQYIRVTPGVDMGTVDVTLADNLKGGSIVEVTYQLTGLSEAGNNTLRKHYSKNNYAIMMKEWRQLIIASKDKIRAHYSN